MGLMFETESPELPVARELAENTRSLRRLAECALRINDRLLAERKPRKGKRA